MTPTLLGRIQTRLFMLATVGVVWTLLVGLVLPGMGTLAETYRTLFAALGLVALFGTLLWEPLYHLLQQFRWEKDWPTGLGLFTGVPEAVLSGLVLAGFRTFPTWVFVVHFATTWVLIWVTVNGPLRMVALRWRYRGGRFF